MLNDKACTYVIKDNSVESAFQLAKDLQDVSQMSQVLTIFSFSEKEVPTSENNFLSYSEHACSIFSNTQKSIE